MWLTIAGIYLVLGFAWAFYGHLIANDVVTVRTSLSTVATQTLFWPVFLTRHILRRLSR